MHLKPHPHPHTHNLGEKRKILCIESHFSAIFLRFTTLDKISYNVIKVTSIIQAKKFIFVVKMLLCCLLSLSDSLIPKERNVPTSSQGTWLLEPTYCCCWMLLPEYVNVSIQSRHNKEKQENGNVWEKAHWSPDRSKKFCPVKLVRFVEVWKVVPEKRHIQFV